MSDVKVSIIMPVYNTAKYLRRCLDSIVSQTLTDWECVAVDDGSNDGSSQILSEYAERDSRFKVLTQSNSGPVVARSRAISEATGEYLLFVDSDDTIEPELLATTVHTADAGKFDIVWFKIATVADGKRIAVMDEPFSPDPKRMISLLLQYRLQGWLWSKLVRRDFWQNADIKVIADCWVMEDTVICLQLLMAQPRIGKVDVIGYNYNRGNTESLTGYSRSHDIVGRSIPNIEFIGQLLRDKGLFEAHRADYAAMVIPVKVYLTRIGNIRQAQCMERWMNCKPAYFSGLGRKKWPYWLLMNGGPVAAWILKLR